MKRLALLLGLALLLCIQVTAAVEPPGDGVYLVEGTLSGGSGRASVETPVRIVVANGEVTATVIWSSPNYALMVVDGEEYAPVNRDGNSIFEIPVTLDGNMAVSAQTIAMSEPHLIQYTLYFDSATIRPYERKSPAYAGIVVALAVLSFCVVLRIRKGRKNLERSG